jgi:hypothetical protein
VCRRASSVGSVTRQVALPALLPSFRTLSVATTVPGAEPGFTAVTAAVNGPMPLTARCAKTASATTAPAIARKTVPWTCELALSRRPSGLHRSHKPTSSGTGAPQRAQAWVGG